MPNKNLIQHILILTIICPLIVLAYAVYRVNFYEVIACFGISFLGYFILYALKSPLYNLKTALNYAVLIRIILLFSIPALSDDFYRFFWDGHVLVNGLNPYQHLPSALIVKDLPGLSNTLFDHLNSPNYYTVYPPVCQLVFWLSAKFGFNNLFLGVIFIKLIFLMADIGNIFLLKNLLAKYQKPTWLVIFYALNPLVIMEFAGNLHFEVLMIFFVLCAIHLYLNKSLNLSAVFMGLAICVKLLPVLFIPLFIKKIGLKKTFIYGFIASIIVLMLFLPFINDLSTLQKLRSSINLYYGKFEFNGSIYQVFKWIGWREFGYNPIALIGKLLLVLSFLGYLIIWRFYKDVPKGIFYILFIFNVFSATLHPWYIIPLLTFSLFSNTKSVMVWSALITLTYFTYRVFPYQESLTIITIEYGLLLIYCSYEWYFKNYLKFS